MRTLGRKLGMAATAAIALSSSGAAQGQDRAAWDSVGQILQTPPVLRDGHARYYLPRRDLTVTVGDVTVASPLALGAWVGFSGAPDDAMLMGDLVLGEAELKPVLAALDREGIAVTAIHSHLAAESPRLTYVHVHAEGDAFDLAARLDRVFALTGTPRPVVLQPATLPTIDTAMVHRMLGMVPKASGAVAQLAPVLVSGSVSLHGKPLVPAMALASPINLQQVSPDRLVATGDFALRAAQVEPVLSALARSGIVATAVHSHLIGESPALYYVHFWADGPPAVVLGGLQAAIDATVGPPPGP